MARIIAMFSVSETYHWYVGIPPSDTLTLVNRMTPVLPRGM